jgi:hypothetical protein
MDERKVRLYKFLVESGKLTKDQVPEEYKESVEVEVEIEQSQE